MNKDNQLILEFQRLILNEESRCLQELVEVIENLLDDFSLLQNKAMKQRVQTEWKGYIPYSIIYKQDKFIKFLDGIGINHFNYYTMSKSLCILIKQYSKKLWSNYGGVRRLNIFTQSKIKSTWFLNGSFVNTKQTFQTLLASKCTIIKIDYISQYQAIVYSKEPQILQELDGTQLFDQQLQRQFIIKVLSQQELLQSKSEEEEDYPNQIFRRLYQTSLHKRQHTKYSQIPIQIYGQIKEINTMDPFEDLTDQTQYANINKDDCSMIFNRQFERKVEEDVNGGCIRQQGENYDSDD